MKSNRPTCSPFDSAAIDRLRRMGLATADGSVERDSMAVFCCIFAGQFFDDLCDYYQDYENVQETTCAITTRTMPKRSGPLSPPWWMARTPAIPTENS